MKKFFILVFLVVISVANSAPLPPNKAFVASTSVRDPNNLQFTVNMPQNYFLYKNRIQIKAKPNEYFKLGEINYPKPEHYLNNQGKLLNIYRNKFSLIIPLLGIKQGQSKIKISYQGCSKEGFCYPKVTRNINVIIGSNGSLKRSYLTKPKQLTSIINKQQVIEKQLSNGHIFFTLITFLGFGILLSFTPCVLPMFPVLSTIIIGQGRNISTRKAFFIALSFVLGLASTYAVLGLFFALIGQNIQEIMQSPIIISLFSLLFVLLALSMFGLYSLRLPQSWQQKIVNLSTKKSKPHYLVSSSLGILTTLILSPCVTPPLIGALGYIANTGHKILGMAALFALGIGMGIPLIIVSVFAGKWLPKTGAWMKKIQIFFGILLLAIAIQLLGRIIPGAASLALWGFLLIGTGIYLGISSFLTKKTYWQFKQVFGIILIAFGTVEFIGAGLHNQDPILPLSTTANALTEPKNVITVYNLNQILSLLGSANKPVVLDFYAKWCATCKIIDRKVLKNPKIQPYLHNIILVRVDITSNNSEAKAVQKHFDVIAPPTFLFFNKNGTEIKSFRVVGNLSQAMLLKRISSDSSQ